MRLTLSIIVPVYNEEQTVATILRKLIKVKGKPQIIIVDDGSTDSSPQIIKRFVTAQRKKGHHLLFVTQKNAGKGSAIRTGLKLATGQYTLIQDADCEYDPEDIPVLLKPVEKARATVVYGSRFFGPHTNLLFWHRVGNHVLNFFVNILYNTTLSDMETCYKLVPTELLQELQITSNSFDIEPEITCKLLKRGVKIYEVPITYSGRDFSEGKKITWRDGISALYTIFALRLF